MMKSPDVICHWFLQFMHHWFSILFVYEANCRHSASLDVAEAFSCFSLSAVFHGKMNVSNVCLDTQAWIMCQCRVCWLVCLVNHDCAKWSTKKLIKGWVWKYCRICIKGTFHEMGSGLQNIYHIKSIRKLLIPRSWFLQTLVINNLDNQGQQP